MPEIQIYYDRLVRMIVCAGGRSTDGLSAKLEFTTDSSDGDYKSG